MATKKQPVLETRALRVGYAEAPVCAPVDLAVHPGELWAVIGPNGSGKSTLLRALLGVLAPLSGKVLAFGREVDERERDFRAKVVGILDDDAYFPGLTAREHLVLTARGHGVPGAGEVVDQLLDRFGLRDQSGAMPTELSSGQRRRLLLAAGFARPREVLVLDEPEQRLDPGMRADLARILVEEAGRGAAVVFATHDPDLVERTGARGLLVGDDECLRLGHQAALTALAQVR